MPKKKSVKKAATGFIDAASTIEQYLQRQKGTQDESWAHEYAILRLYREFERLMLGALIGAINNDTATVSQQTGVQFPKHMTDEVCEYLIVGDGYFDFRGRAGLIKTIKDFVPEAHYLVTILKDSKYKDTLERLAALRNYAAHDSPQAKQRARMAVAQAKIMSAGDWLSTQSRFIDLATACKKLAQAIHDRAPY